MGSYTHGISEGHLYVGDNSSKWPGLVSIDLTPESAKHQTYIDGRIVNFSSDTSFTISIKAYSSPPLFDSCEGISVFFNGAYGFSSDREPFSVSYLREGLEGEELVIIRDAVVTPRIVSDMTDSDTPTAEPLVWDGVLLNRELGEPPYIVLKSKDYNNTLWSHIKNYVKSVTTAPTLYELEYETLYTLIVHNQDERVSTIQGFDDNVIDTGLGTFTLEGPSVKNLGSFYSVETLHQTEG